MRDETVDQRKYLEVRKNALEQSYDQRQLVLRSLQIESGAYLKAKRSYWDELALLQSLKSRHRSVRGRMEMLTVLVAANVEAIP
ncbi:MAG: hypothetical protein OSA48_02060 [Akkermansiaceae bacterium]|nr:hypothetical protein [Akkermansiaceae bacterium]